MLGDFSVLRPNPTSGMVGLGGLGAQGGGSESEMVRWNAVFGQRGVCGRGILKMRIDTKKFEKIF
mgnify:FL=1